jgi:uncharacterized membrane protein YecN with MAPEG domain
MYPLTSLVTIAALTVYFAMVLNVGRARIKYGVKLPAIMGNEDFERVLRVQQNTLEQLIIFLPAVWIFSIYVGEKWAAIAGTVWVIGRIAYAIGYYATAEKRVIGFALTFLSSVVLLGGSAFGIVKSLI